ncbi:ECF transporter S component [Peptoniphilus catoniae]|uniref:ECF transporter S component n=1 Tax=Peptoniphilus catoniae TaxID=1660341 RepID=UPI0010FD96EF|nr:ECF transporter S component [Peptoniphilus catoniae]
MQKIRTKDLVIIGILMTVNVAGSFIAVATKVPLLLDHIGTMMICLIFGWKLAVISAFASSCIMTILFDPYALPFAPTGMLMIFMVGLFLEFNIFNKLTTPFAMALAVLPGAILGAIIAGYIFGGVTSSGSSIIVRFLINMKLNPAVAVFIVQYFMEYLDRLMSFYLVNNIYKRLNLDTL